MVSSLVFWHAGCASLEKSSLEQPEISEETLIGPGQFGIAVREFYYSQNRTSEAVAFYQNFTEFLRAEWRQACLEEKIRSICLRPRVQVVVAHDGTVAAAIIIPAVVDEKTDLPPVTATENIHKETPVLSAKRMAHETAQALGLLDRPLGTLP